MSNEIFKMIVALRGGIPERCDFCEQPYTDERLPVPEEAGDWACTECWDRWEKQDEELRDLSGQERAAAIIRARGEP
jgi:hypothetical protein